MNNFVSRLYDINNNQKVSVVILNRNGKEVINKCIRSIMQSEYKNIEIIVVDNASTDGSRQEIEQNFPLIKWIQCETNLGYGMGNNVGIDNSSGTIILFLNNDTLLKPNTITNVVHCMNSFPKGGIVGCKIYLGIGENVVQYSGGVIGSSGSAHFFSHQNEQQGIQETDCVHGAAFAVRSHVFNYVGTFDSIYYPIYHDEVDICYRTKLSGFSVLFNPYAVAHHLEKTSLTKDINSFGNRFKGHIIFALKYFTLKQLFFRLPFYEIRLLFGREPPMTESAYTKLQIQYKPRIIVSIFYAYIWVIRNMKAIMRSRLSVSKLRNIK